MNSASLRLLILNDSRTEAERLTSLLRSAGRNLRAQHAESEEVLVKLLQEQSWDLLIAADATTNVAPSSAIKHIRRLSRDVPVILQTDTDDSAAIVEGLRLGAADVVRLDDDQHLLLVIAREASNREQRSAKRAAERRLKEIERRNQELLDNSKDGIAFEQDGMFIYVNDSFAEILGYSSRDDLDCMPIIDVVDEGQQDDVKAFLKNFALKHGDLDTASITWHMLNAAGEARHLPVEVRKARYDEELCVQLVVKPSSMTSNTNHDQRVIAAQLEQIRFQDLTTRLPNKAYLVNQLELLVAAAQQEHVSGALVYIQVEDFMGIVQARLGAASADMVLCELAGHMKTFVNADEILGRFSDEGFMLIVPRTTAAEALARADALCRSLCDHIVSLDQATLMFRFIAGVSFINDTTASADEPINFALKALDMVRTERTIQKGLVARLYEPTVSKSQLSTARTSKQMAAMVQKALDQGRFRLLFQPILSLRGSDKEYYEVLLRMVENDTDDMTPAEFFDVAAQMGAMTKIDRWVIMDAIKTLAAHRARGNNTRLIVNLSADSIKDKTLVPWLAVAFKAVKLSPDALLFQVNELDVHSHLNHAKEFTASLAALGSDCCINHFGCALNPFNALAHVTANFIKVDGSFTQELQSGNGEPQALGELVSKLHQHEKITIVPFVENASVLSKLWQSGVHYIQGYYLQGPTEKMNFDFDTEN